MPNFQSEAYLRQMRDMSLRMYQKTGSRAHLRAANEAAFKMQRMAKQAMTQPVEQPPIKRGRPRKEQIDA